MAIDTEAFLRWLKPEEPTREEMEAVGKLKPGDYEIYSEKLNMILTEAMEVFIRTGVSGLLLSGDLAVGIYTPKGDLAAANCGTYLHAITSMLPIKYIIKNFKDNPRIGIKEGDIFYCNDAQYGGIHNPDQIAIMPIYFQGELICWAAAAVHTTETGATEPGGMPVTAKSRHYEGMRLSPIKIGENYEIRDDLLEMTVNYCSRAPRMHTIDLKARITACDRVRLRIQELAKKKGMDFLWGIFRKMIVNAEQGARKRIKSWPDGIYRAVVFTDSIGLKEGLQRVCLSLHKKDDTLTMDFTGTSPENDGSYNAFPHAAVAHTAIYIYGFAFHDLPICVGTYAPIEFLFPKGSVLNPSPDAAVSNSVMICSAVMTLLPICFSKMMFNSPQRDLCGASMGNTGSGYAFGGINQWGVVVADMLAYPLNTEGSGGRMDMDGVAAHGFPWCPFGRAPDAEEVEAEYPLLHLFQKFWKDSGGFGMHPGGVGTQIAWIMHHVPQVAFMSICKNSRIHTAQGLSGGYAPSVIPGIQITNCNVMEMMAQGKKDVPSEIHEMVCHRSIKGNYTYESHTRPTRILKKGDIFVGFASGGAGYGDPLERDLNLVMEEHKKGFISPWVVREVYHVEYNPETLEVDYETTERLRTKEREERRRRGKRFEDFEREWLKKKPKEEILYYYGSWPDGKKIREIERI